MASPLTMSKEKREAFLADLHVGVLSVAAPDGGAPLTAPIWYRYEPGGDVVISTGADSAKHQALAAAGRASFCVQREDLPYAFVTVEGAVTITGHDEAERTRLAGRYLGEELATAYLAATQDERVVTVRLTPDRWRTQDYAQVSFG